jgi:cathepsin B
MKVALVVLVCAVAHSMAGTIRTDLKPQSDELVDYINSLGTTWKAGHNARTKKMSLEAIKGLMGVKPYDPLSLPITNNDHLPNDIPDTFDARTQWPKCTSIGEIRDQSNCGSCWAVAAAEAISDRICISTDEIVDISALDLMSCCRACGQGCEGGYPPQAWQYWARTGLVTGGLYQSKGCEPYPLPPCEHHINSTHYPACSQSTAPTPKCASSCQSGYNVPYGQDKHFGAKAYGVSSSVEAIQKEIQANGPVEADIDVYDDFLSYKSGVYQHTTGSNLGGHAIKILGWGTENNTPYWLVANSWNADWGDKGYIKFIRGKDDCGIESGINAGTPKKYQPPPQ